MSNGRLTKKDLSPSLAQEIDETAAQVTELEGKSTELATQLAQKANKEEINTLATEKADKIFVETELVKKATPTDIVNAVTSKADKSYVDNLAQSLANGSPKGTYATLSALQAAFPTGNSNIYLVLGDGKWYYWNGTAWAAGGQYQSTGIADGSITTSKKTPLGEFAFILAGSSSVPNFDFTNRTLKIPANSELFNRNVGYSLGGLEVTISLTLPGSYARGFITFNPATLAFKTYDTSTRASITEGEILVGTYNLDSKQAYMAAQYTINGKPPFIQATGIPMDIVNIYPMWKTCTVLTGGGNLPYVDNVNKKLVFPSNPYDWIFYVGGTAYGGIIPPAGISIDLASATGTSAWCILFSLSDKSFSVVQWSSAQLYKATHALLATFRISSSKYYFNMQFPFTVDNALYGHKDVSKVVVNPLNANVKAVCHRGYIDAPENTLPAYKLAKQKGFTYVECDVEWTSDGIPILLHDSTINRTSNGTGTANTLTLVQLKTYDFGSWKSPAYAGTQIPTFEEFILLCKKLNLHPYIEIKGVVSSTQAQTLINIVKKLGMLDNITWIGSYASSLTNVLGIYAESRVIMVMGEYHPALRDQAIQLKALSKKKVGVSIASSGLTKESAETVINDGFDLEVYTINTESEVGKFVEMGVSGITTDFLNITEILSK